MKKILLAFALALLASVSVSAQNARFTYANTTAGASTGVLEIGSGVQYHQLTWNVSGSAPTCQVQLDQSADNITWSSQIIPTQTCTSNGLSSVSAAMVANYVRINITTKSGAGTVTVTYLGFTSSPSGGGTVTGTGASPRVAFWASATALGSDPTFTWADGTNAVGLFQGPATSTFGSNISIYAGILQPEMQVNRHVLVGDPAANPMGTGFFTQIDSAASSFGKFSVSDFTNAPSSAVGGEINVVFVNVPMGNTNGNLQPAYEGQITAYGAGNQNVLATFASSGAGNSGAGTVTTASGFNAAFNNNSGAGLIHNSYGYSANDMSGVGDTLNAGFFAAAQTAGANNWGFFSNSANKDHFGSLFSGTDNSVAGSLTISNSAANAHTIFSSGATTTNTIAGFTVVPTTGHLVTCTSSGTTCTLTDGGAISSIMLPINNVTSATGPIATIADGNNPLIINCALTSGTTCLTTGETTAATTAGAVELQVTTLTTSTAIPLQITQGAAGPANANAPNVLNISNAATGGAASGANSGFMGAQILLQTGAGSAAGPMGTTGGNGGNYTVLLGAGGGCTLTTCAGSQGGTFVVTGAAGSAGGATGAGGPGSAINLSGAAGGAGGATSGTGGGGSPINLTAGNGGAAAVGSTTGKGGDIIATLGNAGGAGTPGLPGIFKIVGQSVAGSNTSPILSITDTWNTTGVVDAAILLNVTNTASGAASLLQDLQVGGVSQWKVDKAGNVTAAASLSINGGSALTTSNQSGTGNLCLTTSCTMVTPALGTPSALVLTNATGLPFSSIASATNTAAAMVIGTGASLTTSGTGTIATTTQFTDSAAGAASVAAETLSGTLFTGGSGTTTFPHFYINQGTGPTTFSTNGTTFGINAPSGFTGNFLDFHLNGGASVYAVDRLGDLTISGNINNASITSASNSSAKNYLTASNCSGVGTAANPSVASCGSSSAGAFSCATNASTGTCQVNTTGVGANSIIFVQEDDSLGTKLGVTCNTNNVLPATAPLLGARNGGTSFTINLGTFTTNPLCYGYWIVNF